MVYDNKAYCDYCKKIKMIRRFVGKLNGKKYRICEKCETNIKNMK